jgi:uncharacterized protein YjbI with pentapeptide repeats
VDLTGASLVSAQLNSMSLVNANLTNVDLRYANLDSATLTGAIGMAGDDLAGVIWDDTICPDGTNSNADGNTCAGHLTP